MYLTRTLNYFLKNTSKNINKMTSAIEILHKQALETFSGCNNSKFQLCKIKFEKLQLLMNEITAKDVYINNEILSCVKKQTAPMCVINIFENDDITIAIFILKEGVTLPLHDHPKMYGLLKLLSGKVNVQPYTLEDDNETIKREGVSLFALKHKNEILEPRDSSCLLTPHLKNLHEISCIEGPAAFLDVLSPPYFSDSNMHCSYFTVAKSEESEQSGKVKLIVSKCPTNFYSRNLRYLGPPLQ